MAVIKPYAGNVTTSGRGNALQPFAPGANCRLQAAVHI